MDTVPVILTLSSRASHTWIYCCETLDSEFGERAGDGLEKSLGVRMGRQTTKG